MDRASTYKHGGLLTLDAACDLHDIPRALFDQHAAEGDTPALQMLAGEIVVEARLFAAWATLAKAELAGRCAWCE